MAFERLYDLRDSLAEIFRVAPSHDALLELNRILSESGDPFILKFPAALRFVFTGDELGMKNDHNLGLAFEASFNRLLTNYLIFRRDELEMIEMQAAQSVYKYFCSIITYIVFSDYDKRTRGLSNIFHENNKWRDFLKSGIKDNMRNNVLLFDFEKNWTFPIDDDPFLRNEGEEYIFTFRISDFR